MLLEAGVARTLTSPLRPNPVAAVAVGEVPVVVRRDIQWDGRCAVRSTREGSEEGLLVKPYGLGSSTPSGGAGVLNLALLANFMKQREGLGDKVWRGVVSTFTTVSVTISVFWAQILDKDCQG